MWRMKTVSSVDIAHKALCPMSLPTVYLLPTPPCGVATSFSRDHEHTVLLVWVLNQFLLMRWEHPVEFTVTHVKVTLATVFASMIKCPFVAPVTCVPPTLRFTNEKLLMPPGPAAGPCP